MAKVTYMAAQVRGTTHPKQYAGIYCPACQELHFLGIGPHANLIWSFNGDDERPVFGPSLLLQRDMWVPPVTLANMAQYRAQPWEQRQERHVCHSFIGCGGAQPGQIIYLGDCTHAMAGKVVDLPHIPVPTA